MMYLTKTIALDTEALKSMIVFCPTTREEPTRTMSVTMQCVFAGKYTTSVEKFVGSIRHASEGTIDEPQRILRTKNRGNLTIERRLKKAVILRKGLDIPTNRVTSKYLGRFPGPIFGSYSELRHDAK